MRRADVAEVQGAICLVCGLGGATGHVVMAVTSPVGTAGLTFPQGATELIGLQMLIALVHVGLVLGLLGLWSSGPVPRTRAARIALAAALATTALLTVTEGLAVTVPPSVLDGTPPALGMTYGAVTILLGIALLGLGLAMGRSRLLLGLGLWLLLVMLPALALSHDAARWALSAWLLLVARLGWQVLRTGVTAPSATVPLPPEHHSRRGSARAAAVLTWVYAAAFGAPTIPVAVYLAANGRLPSFLDAFVMYGGPWSVPVDPKRVLLLLAAFLVVTAAAAGAAWLVWNGSRRGAVLAVALLPVEAAFWYGFALPLPWLLGLVRALLLIVGWKALERPGAPEELRGGRRP